MWRGLIIFLAIASVLNGYAQKDTTSLPVLLKTDVIPYDSVHSPKTATILAAIIPSAGHMYNHLKKLPHHKNKLWWKLPIIYGGIGGGIYMTGYNHSEFKAFKQERINRLDPGYNYLSGSFSVYSTGQLAEIQEQYRKWRDMSVIATLGVYLLQLIDANVEAHLMHFDTSDDLSWNFRPVFFTAPFSKGMYTGLTISLQF
jgi:hypothetical protein